MGMESTRGSCCRRNLLDRLQAAAQTQEVSRSGVAQPRGDTRSLRQDVRCGHS